MKLYFFIIICMIFFLPLIQAQEEEQIVLVLMQGVVMDAANQQAIPNAHLILNGERGKVTDENGKFSLYISSADTLLFSHLGYSNVQFILSDTLIGNAFVAGIFLETDTTSIGEVIVVPRIVDLKAQIRSTNPAMSSEMVNARNNITASTWQGLNSSSTLGDPVSNYDLIKRKQTLDAYEKGGIPSDKMISLNPITFIPAMIYLAANGLPKRPQPPKPKVSQQEIDEMIAIYRKRLEMK